MKNTSLLSYVLINYKNLLYLIFVYPFKYIYSSYLKRKSKFLVQQIRVNLYKQSPFMQGDVGIGYKEGKLYDFLLKEYI